MSKLDTSKLPSMGNPLNIPTIFLTFFVLKFLTFKVLNLAQPWNIKDISVTLDVSKFDISILSNNTQLSNK